LTVTLSTGITAATVTITSASGGDVSLDGTPLFSLAPRGSLPFQVALGSHTLSLSSSGVLVQGTIVVTSQPAASGTVAVNATLDGAGSPWSGPAAYSVTCGYEEPKDESTLPLSPITITPVLSTFTCVVSFTSGGPPNSTVTGITYDIGSGATSCGALTLGPTCGATLTRGGSLTFTLQFATNPPPVGTFSSAASMNVPRTSHQATLLTDGRILVTGGIIDSANDATDTAELYNPLSQVWQFTNSPMSSARADHRAVVMTDGRVLIIGGSYTNTVEIFDPATGLFTPTGSMAVPRDQAEAALLTDGRVIVIGGMCGENNGCGYYGTPTVEIYTPSTGLWSSAADIPVGYTGIVGHRVVVNDGKVLVFAGDDGYSRGSAYDSVFSYDPTADTWTTLTPLNEGLQEPTVLTLADGRVFITGGVTSSSVPTNDTEIYDPTASDGQGSASWGPPLNQPRHVHGAAQLSDGSVIVAGGEYSCDGCAYGVLSSVEYLASIDSAWAKNGSLNVGRAWFTLTLLANNQAFAVGGVIPDLTITPTAEVWAK